jgi:polyhydroxyalkanoate synthase
VQLGQQPEAALRQQFAYQTELARIWLGDQPDDDPNDPRFVDKAWKEDPLFRRLRQSWFAWTRSLDAWLESSGLDGIERQRGAFLLEIAKEVFAPVNSTWTPETIQRAIDTRGQSLLNGIRNFLDDQQHNHGYPAIADRKAFQVGIDVAPTEGKVVWREPLFELIQYTPVTPRVHKRPLLYVFSQVNRFYLGDLTRERSLFRQLLEAGIQVYAISWKNPLPEHAGWSLETYADGVISAIRIMRRIAGVKRIDLMGLCAGGLTAAVAAGVLDARGDNWI